MLEGEFDPTKEDNTLADRNNDDDGTDTQPLLPSPPPPPPEDPYHGSEQHEMTRVDPEQSGLPKRGPDTIETSFIEGTPLGRVWSSDTFKIMVANEAIKQEYPQYGENGKYLILKVKDGKVFIVGPRGGETPLFMDDNRTLNPKMSKTDNYESPWAKED